MAEDAVRAARSNRRELRSFFLSIAFALIAASFSAASGQSGSTPAASPAAQSAPPAQAEQEISTHDETATFKVRVNLVEVRVVVRDAQGHALGDLKQESFQLFDNGKPQTITKFSVEKAGVAPIVHRETEAAAAAADKPTPESASVVPQRYIAYLFDDVHLTNTDLPTARNAAAHQLESMRPTDRVAIYTTSGQVQQDFTDDRAQLLSALNRVIPRPIGRSAVTDCPNISYYMADLIQNKNDPRALQIATLDTLHCAYSDNTAQTAAAQQVARTTAMEQLSIGDQETRVSLGVLQNVIRRIAGMPGERTIILVSPGFINPDAVPQQTDLMERALHSNVIINTLDARGLVTNMPDVSEERPPSASIAGYMLEYEIDENQADDDILAELAYTTGGTFFHNNNDLREGLQRLASSPEYSYLLGFVPQQLKLDGKYHKIKVTLQAPAKGIVQARRGYYAPKGVTDPSEVAKQAIEDAVLSRDEVRDIPVELHTQFFKPDANSARLSVLVHMDVRHVHYRKADGRNNDDLTVVSAVFDRNGNFVSGIQKVLQLHLKDDTLQRRLDSGITLKSSFDVAPGSYLIRLVVRDQDGQLSAQNTAVDIPQ